MKTNWIIHFIIDQCSSEGLINSHTHGMEKYGHMDFQLVLPYKQGEIGYLLNAMGRRVQEGERFKAGQMVNGLYVDCPVRLDLHRETGREVFRLIVPDELHHFPEHPLCRTPYKYQTLKVFER